MFPNTLPFDPFWDAHIAMATLELAGEHGLRADVERLLKDSGAYAATDKATRNPLAVGIV